MRAAMTESPASTSPLRRLVRGGSVYVASNFARAFLGFGMSLVIGRGLGDVRFGRWTFCMAWASALTMVCDLGLNVLLTREVAKPGSAGRRLLAAAVLAKLLLLAPIGLLVFWAAPWVGIEAESTAALRGAVFLAAAGAAYGCFAAVFRGVEWFIPLVVMETAGLAVQLLGSVWIVWSGGTVLDLVVLAFAVQMVQLSVAAGLWQLWAPPRGRLVPPSWGLAGRMIRLPPFRGGRSGRHGSGSVQSAAPRLSGEPVGARSVRRCVAARRTGETDPTRNLRRGVTCSSARNRERSKPDSQAAATIRAWAAGADPRHRDPPGGLCRSHPALDLWSPVRASLTDARLARAWARSGSDEQ